MPLKISSLGWGAVNQLVVQAENNKSDVGSLELFPEAHELFHSKEVAQLQVTPSSAGFTKELPISVA